LSTVDPFAARGAKGVSDFEDETFERLDLRGVRVVGKTFEDCTFVAAQAAEASFESCRFSRCTFKDSDLSNAKLTSSTLRGLTCTDSKLLGINWTRATAVADLAFTRCVVSYGNFSGLNLRGSRFLKCLARETELAHADLTEAIFTETDFSGSRFHKTNLSRADFRGAINYAMHPTDNILKRAKFSLPEATALLYALDIELDK
jgi:fluoroquinolone resistance protein